MELPPALIVGLGAELNSERILGVERLSFVELMALVFLWWEGDPVNFPTLTRLQH
jgi:hypothetical protein